MFFYLALCYQNNCKSPGSPLWNGTVVETEVNNKFLPLSASYNVEISLVIIIVIVVNMVTY